MGNEAFNRRSHLKSEEDGGGASVKSVAGPRASGPVIKSKLV